MGLFAGLNFIVTRGGLGLTIGPGNFQMTFHPSGPARVKIIKNSEITFFPCKNDRFFTFTLPAHRALPKCKHGQSASDRDHYYLFYDENTKSIGPPNRGRSSTIIIKMEFNSFDHLIVK